MKKFLLLLVFSITLCNTFFGQCMLVPVPLSSRAGQSELIIKGRVVSSQSFWNAQHTRILTSHLVQVQSALKGSADEYSNIEVITQGGEVGLDRHVVEPSLQLSSGDEGVFLLKSTPEGSSLGIKAYEAYADQQGFIKFDSRNDVAREPFKTYQSIDNELKPTLEHIIGKKLPLMNSGSSNNKFAAPASIASISGISPSTITAGTFSVLSITGSGFGATQGSSIVEFLNADDGGATFIQPHASQYTSWSNTLITVMIPTKTSTCGTAGTGQVRVTVGGNATLSAQSLTVAYGQLNVYYAPTNSVTNTRHIGLNGNGGINWQMYTGFDANATAKAAFVRAFNTWRCTTNINWQLGTAVATNSIGADGVNVIRFDIGAELPAGVLGRCTSYYSGCTLGGNVYFYVSELDICFDDATSWQFGPALATGSQYDFESVTLHELGHGHQLSHVIDNNDVMHWSIANAVNKRTLVTNDINGASNEMARNLSGAVCGLQTMTALAPATCSLTSPTASFNLAGPVCVGQTVSLTSLSIGGPTNWNWTMTGGSPGSATLQNTSTSYSLPGVYTVTLQAVNGMGSSSQTKTITVVAIPTVAVTSDSVCPGGSASLTASGATSYTWNPGALTGSAQTFSPGATTNYTVLGSNGTCTNTAVGTITVATPPSVSANLSSTLICTGDNATITLSGANNYTTNPGNFTNSVIVVSPTVTTTYSVTGVSVCTGSTSTTLAVSPCTGLENAGAMLNMIVFPNPAKAEVNIQFSNTFSGKIELYNSLGQILISKNINAANSERLNLSGLPQGVYLLKTTADNKRGAYTRIIKE
jgi:PKD repeat protein